MEKTHPIIPKYNLLNFIETIQIKDPERYNELKSTAIVVYIFGPRRSNYSDEVRSSYTACWGDEIRVCGQTSLELNELEELLYQDKSRLGNEGIFCFINGGNRRIIHSVRHS